MANPLVCPGCSAPLPVPTGGFVTCSYCRLTSSLDGLAARAVPSGPPPGAPRSFEARTSAATAVFRARLGAGASPDRAALDAALAYESPGLDPREVAQGAVALAKHCDAENRTATLRDPACMVRLFEAYAKAAREIRECGRAAVCLPFLTVGPAGPVTFERELDARALARLLATSS